jgi:hypothetical protein
MNINIIIIIIITIIIFLLTYYFHSIKNSMLIKNKSYLLDINDDCKYKRFGCCFDKITTKLDKDGTNCRGF